MSHRRYNPLLGDWVIVAANRVNRPWQGAKEPDVKVASQTKPEVKNCLAPGGVRGTGIVTPDYEGTYVFQNDYPTFVDDGAPDEESSAPDPNDLFQSQKIKGTCRVICYHPSSNLTMAHMTEEQIENVVNIWIDQLNDLKAKYEWIQVFENKGAIMGCSNPHPHGQLWASNYLPNEPRKKYRSQKEYAERTKRIMLMDYMRKELESRERLVVENEEWLVVVPYWAFWPFETVLLPKKHITALYDVNSEQKKQLANILKQLLVKYDNLFECSFPYSMGWHGAPTGQYLKEDCSFWTLHAVFFPPLLRSATVKKFLAGYELLAEFQRDITPEKHAMDPNTRHKTARKAAEMLRTQSDMHYSLASSSSTPMSS